MISESASALNPWTYNRNYVENAYQIATNLGNPLNSASTQALVDYLRTVPADNLRKASDLGVSLYFNVKVFKFSCLSMKT